MFDGPSFKNITEPANVLLWSKTLIFKEDKTQDFMLGVCFFQMFLWVSREYFKSPSPLGVFGESLRSNMRFW